MSSQRWPHSAVLGVFKMLSINIVLNIIHFCLQVGAESAEGEGEEEGGEEY